MYSPIQQIKRIESAVDCQWFCTVYYSEECTWFSYDDHSKYCKIFSGSPEDLYEDCYELGFPSQPSLFECMAPMNESNAEPCRVKLEHNYFKATMIKIKLLYLFTI